MTRDVCGCVFCERDFERSGERYVGRWTDEQRKLTKDYWNHLSRLDHVPFERATIFGKRHAATFGSRGNGPVRIVARKLRKIAV